MNKLLALLPADAAASVLLPLLIALVLRLAPPLADRYLKKAAVREEAYPMRLARELMRQSGVGRPLEHGEDAEAEDGGEERPIIYLDWNATSQVSPEVALSMLPYLYSRCGNPGSAHAFGRDPRAAVARARAAVAEAIGAESPDRIVFASCGTEAINWALRAGIRAGWQRGLGSMKGGEERRPHVITTAVEHPAVLVLLRHMEGTGEIDLSVVGVCKEGRLRLPELLAAFKPETALVAAMHANNEVGALQPTHEVAAICRARGALLFVDAAQSVGKVKVHVGEALGWPDLVSIVGHKFGAPKGVAALYVRKGLELGEYWLSSAGPGFCLKRVGPYSPITQSPQPKTEPMLLGGGQERGRRSGTEAVLLLVGLGEAAAIVTRELSALERHLSACTGRLRERLVAELGGEVSE